MSSSSTAGISHASSDTRSSTSTSSSRSTAGDPRNSSSMLDTRVRAISSRARKALSGGSATAESRKISTATPPMPKLTTGPKVGSRVRPTISSRPCGRTTIFCTSTPMKRADGARSARRCAMASKPRSTSSAVSHAEDHAADVALVRDAVGTHLQHDRESQLLCRLTAPPSRCVRRAPRPSRCRTTPAAPWSPVRRAYGGRHCEPCRRCGARPARRTSVRQCAAVAPAAVIHGCGCTARGSRTTRRRAPDS